jgi:(E)-4-hydroxy-3-methylbut-2-enyl-diphosphate synthase
VDIFNYQRRQTTVVHAGTIDIGGDNSIRLQSMTTTNTDDTEASVAQSERIIKAGGELVRLTTQGRREAENLKNIKAGLLADGFDTPLVADVHFNANVADVAALYADKVRVNPGNYVDPARTFKKIDYTDEEYAAELKKIDDRFVPFLNICKQHHTAIRIGVNHGSLSDRIRNRYGDTPAGIVESCMEFLRICKREKFNDVVISIKSSNTVVMVQSVRLLVDAMDREDMHYPLHLGVTEAGEGEDGRIKSAVGIGALLADGIGDTVRVSLSEEPEEEVPVAKHLVDYLTKHAAHVLIPGTECKDFNYLSPQRRPTNAVGNIGGSNVPVVISSRINGAETASKSLSDAPKPDYLYVGEKLPERLENGQKYIVDFTAWKGEPDTFPIFPYNALPFIGMNSAKLKFLVLQFGAPTEEYIACLKIHPEVVVICMSNHQNRLGDQRALVHEIWEAGLKNPVIFAEMYNHKRDEGSEIKDNGCEMKDKNNTEEIKPLTSQLSPLTCLQIEAAADMGALMIDGLCDGLWLMNYGDISDSDIDSTAFGILQAARLRMIKTEYISCPGCGRTLYDLRSTIAKVKDATKGMKGLKIGIMGCIVNGPGEMADADYGYVGAGPKKISLYRGKTCVEHAIPEDEAVEHLLALIKADRNE